MKRGKFIFLFIIISIVSLSVILANNTELNLERQNRLKFGHILFINNVTTVPIEFIQGQVGILKFNVENTGADFIRDIRIRLQLPEQLATFEDITQNKIAELKSGENRDVEFKIFSTPDADEGIYKIPILTEYVNYVGDQRQENETLSIIISSNPKIYAEVINKEIYTGNLLGNIKIRVVNNDLANIKFLTVQLNQTKYFKIIGTDKGYIGELNSDDTSEIPFRIKVSNFRREINLPVTLTYKNSMNKDFTQEFNLNLKIVSAKELGIKNNNAWILILLVIVTLGYIYYRKKKKAKLKANFR